MEELFDVKKIKKNILLPKIKSNQITQFKNLSSVSHIK